MNFYCDLNSFNRKSSVLSVQKKKECYFTHIPITRAWSSFCLEWLKKAVWVSALICWAAVPAWRLFHLLPVQPLWNAITTLAKRFPYWLPFIRNSVAVVSYKVIVLEEACLNEKLHFKMHFSLVFNRAWV